MKPPHDFPTALRREIALNIRNNKDKDAEQQCNFDDIVQEKLHTAADLG